MAAFFFHKKYTKGVLFKIERTKWPVIMTSVFRVFVSLPVRIGG